MKKPLSLTDIEVLIWCYCNPEPHERINAPAVQDSLKMWRDAGMIEPAHGCPHGTFRTTPEGVAMIDALRHATVPAKVDEPTENLAAIECDPPCCVGASHIRFTDHKGFVRVVPRATLTLLADTTNGKRVFGCCGFYTSARMHDRIEAILKDSPVFEDFPKSLLTSRRPKEYSPNRSRDWTHRPAEHRVRPVASFPAGS